MVFWPENSGTHKYKMLIGTALLAFKEMATINLYYIIKFLFKVTLQQGKLLAKEMMQYFTPVGKT